MKIVSFSFTESGLQLREADKMDSIASSCDIRLPSVFSKVSSRTKWMYLKTIMAFNARFGMYKQQSISSLDGSSLPDDSASAKIIMALLHILEE